MVGGIIGPSECKDSLAVSLADKSLIIFTDSLMTFDSK